MRDMAQAAVTLVEAWAGKCGEAHSLQKQLEAHVRAHLRELAQVTRDFQ